MSLEAQIWAVEQRAGDPVAKFLLLVLAGDADEWGCSTISRERIAQLTEMTPVDIDRAIKQLRAYGLLRAGTRGAGELRLALWE